VVPPLNPDVAILHAQRADAKATRNWGVCWHAKGNSVCRQACHRGGEELVDESVIRADPIAFNSRLDRRCRGA